MNKVEAISLYEEAITAACKRIEGRKDGGSCGSADVRIRDARQPFVRHLRAAGIGAPSRPGWSISPPVGREIQDINVHEDAARAMADVFTAAGIKVSVKVWSD